MSGTRAYPRYQEHTPQNSSHEAHESRHYHRALASYMRGATTREHSLQEGKCEVNRELERHKRYVPANRSRAALSLGDVRPREGRGAVRRRARAGTAERALELREQMCAEGEGERE